MRCPSFAVPSVSDERICVWPRVNRPEPCERGLTPTSTVIARMSSGPLPLEQHRERRLGLDLADDVVLGRVHRQLRCELGLELLDDRSRLAQADLLDPLPDRGCVLRLEVREDLHVEPLGLAGLLPQLL